MHRGETDIRTPPRGPQAQGEEETVKYDFEYCYGHRLYDEVNRLISAGCGMPLPIEERIEGVLRIIDREVDSAKKLSKAPQRSGKGRPARRRSKHAVDAE